MPLSEPLPPSARVLVTAPADPERLEWIARRVPRGSMIVLAGEISSLPSLRRLLSGLDNAMASPGSRDDIPWADRYFSLIVDAAAGSPTAEMLRVLAPGGSILVLQDLADDL